MERTQTLLGEAGIVGEETNRLLLYYFKGEELKHKLLLIEDLDGANEVLYPLRELQSKGRPRKTVAVKGPRGMMQTEILSVEGPVSVAAATTKETLYQDNANRALLLTLDESAEQDKRILDYQRKLASGAIDTQKQTEARKLLQATQRLLQPVHVQNPFAESLQLPSQVFTQRRANQLYLDLIGAITFYHQHQRKTTKENGRTTIETVPEDIEWANKLAAPVLLRKSDELSGACRSFLEELKSYLAEHKQDEFTSHEIR